MSESNNLFAAIAAGDGALLNTLLAQQPVLVNTRSPAGVSLVPWTYLPGKQTSSPLFSRPIRSSICTTRRRWEIKAGYLDLLQLEPALARRYAHDGFTALHLVAFFTNSTATLPVVLDAGAQVDAIARNSQQVTPLHSAIAGGQATIARFLVERGANVNARQERGSLPSCKPLNMETPCW